MAETVGEAKETTVEAEETAVEAEETTVEVEDAPDQIGELLCRPARYEDRQDVVRIECYQGMDFLDAFFDEYHYGKKLKCPMYCGEVNGVIVTFLGLLLMDEGRSVQFIARRTRVGHEGLGYSTMLRDYSIRCLRRRFPLVSRYFQVAQLDAYTEAYLSKRRWNTLMEMSTINVAPVDAGRITLPPDLHSAHVVRLRDSHVAEYVIQHCQHLHPENLFLVQYKVFQLTVPNLKALEPLPSFVKLSNGKVRSLSCRTDYVCRLGQLHHIDIRTHDYNDVIVHLRAHFAELKTLDSGGRKRVFRIHVSPRITAGYGKARLVGDLEELFNVEPVPMTAAMKVIEVTEEVNLKYGK